jgi:hypothetical protein
MDSFLSLIGKLVPLGFSLLSLWIKAFDSGQHLTRAGKFMLGGLAASAILVISVDQLDKELSKISSDQENQVARLEEKAFCDPVKADDVILKLEGHSDSIRKRRHPKYLFADWNVSLQEFPPQNVEDALSGIAIDGRISTEPENDEEGTGFYESRTFSHFVGASADLVRADAWNGKSFSIKVSGAKNFFPETLDDWMLEGKDAKTELESIRQSREPDNNRIGEWRMLPLLIHVELVVQGQRVARTQGHIVFYRPVGSKRAMESVVMLPLSVRPDAFKTKDNSVKPPTPTDLAKCMGWRIAASFCCLVAIAFGSLAARVQLRSKADLSHIDTP